MTRHRRRNVRGPRADSHAWGESAGATARQSGLQARLFCDPSCKPYGNPNKSMPAAESVPRPQHSCGGCSGVQGGPCAITLSVISAGGQGQLLDVLFLAVGQHTQSSRFLCLQAVTWRSPRSLAACHLCWWCLFNTRASLGVAPQSEKCALVNAAHRCAQAALLSAALGFGASAKLCPACLDTVVPVW